MFNYPLDEIVDRQIFKSIELINDLLYERGFLYCPYMFKPKDKNEFSLGIMKMDFLNVENIPNSIGSFVKGNKTDMNICLKSLARYINNEIVNTFVISKNKEEYTREDIIKTIDSILID
ncbi:MAG: hypothetical protein ACXAC2_00225 [Candidatus Kariarchaeaceae archaeon]|jgi:hypothetical protein